jgi:hypothetical protein
MMKALVYHGPGQRGWDTVDDPTIIDQTDIVVRIDTSTICGSDLHFAQEFLPNKLGPRQGTAGAPEAASLAIARNARHAKGTSELLPWKCGVIVAPGG